jgi:NADH-quinone oxidoreductase subunit J
MTQGLLIFYPSAIVAIAATLMVVLSRNPVYAVMYLVMSLFSVALVFLSLGSPFLAALEVIVYAGAIVVLFLFVVMMLNLGQRRDEEDLQRPSRKQLLLPGFFAIVLLVETLICLFAGPAQGPGMQVQTKALGYAMYDRHYLGVILSALILIVGTIGGVYLGSAASYQDSKEVPLDGPK